jgi:hypothetical protein
MRDLLLHARQERTHLAPDVVFIRQEHIVVRAGQSDDTRARGAILNRLRLKLAERQPHGGDGSSLLACDRIRAGIDPSAQADWRTLDRSAGVGRRVLPRSGWLRMKSNDKYDEQERT